MSKANRRTQFQQSGAGRALVGRTGSPASATRQSGAIIVDSAGAVSIDITKLEAPIQAYDADVGWIEHRPGNVSLFFAKLSRDEPGTLKGRLEIRYPPEDLLLTFWDISESFIKRLQDYVADWPSEARSTLEPPLAIRANQSHSEWASFTYMSHAGTEAALDFYHIPTAAVARFAQNKDLAGLRVKPILRVQITTFELLSLIERVRPIVEAIRQYLPERHRRKPEARAETDAEIAEGESAE